MVDPPCGLLLFDHKNTYVKVRDRLILPGGVRAYRVALPPFWPLAIWCRVKWRRIWRFAMARLCSPRIGPMLSCDLTAIPAIRVW